MVEKKRFNVMIAGRPYTILASRTQEHMHAVVEILNTQFQQLNELSPQLSLADRSILMAANAVSDQLLKEARIIALEEEVEKLKQQISLNKRPATQPIPYRKRL